mgnify:CR=1
MSNLKEYTSEITVTWSINNHRATSKEEYIETLKLQFKEDFDIYLEDSEITHVQESEEE